MPFPPEAAFHYNAAQGYFELGMHDDSEAELNRLGREFHDRPEVLALRVANAQGMSRWPAMQAAARKLARMRPGDPRWALAWAYATRRAESVELARLVLAEALERHPLVALIHYNLACYDCVLGETERSKEALRCAFRLEPEMRETAREDPDLEPLWPWVGSVEI